MKKACQISAEAHVEAMKFVKPGMTEQEMEAFYQYEFSGKKEEDVFLPIHPL